MHLNAESLKLLENVKKSKINKLTIFKSTSIKNEMEEEEFKNKVKQMLHPTEVKIKIQNYEFNHPKLENLK